MGRGKAHELLSTKPVSLNFNALDNKKKINFNKLGSICCKKKMDGRKKITDQQIQFVQLKKENYIVIQPLTASEEDHDIKRRNHTRKQTIRN